MWVGGSARCVLVKVQLIETRADMHSCSQLTMAASSSSLSGTSPSESEGTSRQSDSGHSNINYIML